MARCAHLDVTRVTVSPPNESGFSMINPGAAGALTNLAHDLSVIAAGWVRLIIPALDQPGNRRGSRTYEHDDPRNMRFSQWQTLGAAHHCGCIGAYPTRQDDALSRVPRTSRALPRLQNGSPCPF